ncbi:Do family serine endopeptidase [Blattabacterium cuenoti]|uniref:Do family serine endopeptidase n=1 Tax=Blattabacterium cuenoti TaxID=1653831 RepID=UPI00163BE470
MNRIVFYIVLSSIMSSIITVAAYKQYNINKRNNLNFQHGSSAPFLVKTKSASSDPASIVSSSGLPDFTRVVEKTIYAVVNVKNYSRKYNFQNQLDPFDFFFGPDSSGIRRGRNHQHQKNDNNNDDDLPGIHGSGVIISPDGYIVTNNHVIKDAEKIEVTLNDQRTYKARLIGADSSTDIALLKINDRNLPFIYFSDSDKVRVGEWVLAIGNPFDLNSTVTAGIISAKNRSLGILREETQSAIESFFQTDAAVNPGNSGGALINTNGELIGINTAISSSSGNFIGYSFAAPSNLVAKVIQDIRKYGSVQRAYLGVRGMDLSKAEYLKDYNKETNQKIKSQQGFLIGEVFQKSGAGDAGLKKGDIIKKVDGRQIQNIADLSFVVGVKHPGDKIKINIIRNGYEKSFDVTLRDLKGRARIRNREEVKPSELLGATFKELNKKYKKNFGIDYGILITEIDNGYLNSIGIKAGDIILFINGNKIKKPDDVDHILNKYTGRVVLKFIRNNRQIFMSEFEII